MEATFSATGASLKLHGIAGGTQDNGQVKTLTWRAYNVPGVPLQ